MFVFLEISMVMAAISNAIMDNIDHHKGAQNLNDLWHLVKYIFGLSLLGVGFFLGKVELIPIHNQSYIFAATVLLCKPIWDYFYYNHIDFWVNLDNKWKFSTGIAWLDHLLGFDKHATNNKLRQR